MKRLDSVKKVAEESDVVITAVGKPYQIREVNLNLYVTKYTGRVQLIRSHSSAQFSFELSGNLN